MTDLEKVQKTLSDVFDYLNGNNLQLVGKELLTDVGDAHRIVENLAINGVSQRSELFAEQDSKDFILWQRDRGIRRLENGKYKWREFEYNREFFLEKHLEDRNKANCG